MRNHRLRTTMIRQSIEDRPAHSSSITFVNRLVGGGRRPYPNRVLFHSIRPDPTAASTNITLSADAQKTFMGMGGA